MPRWYLQPPAQLPWDLSSNPGDVYNFRLISALLPLPHINLCNQRLQPVATHYPGKGSPQCPAFLNELCTAILPACVN